MTTQSRNSLRSLLNLLPLKPKTMLRLASSALPQKLTGWFIINRLTPLCLQGQGIVLPDLCPGEKTALFSPEGPTGRQASPTTSLLFRCLGELIHLSLRARPTSSPSSVEVHGLACLSGQQLQEEEMETLHCHGASFSAKEQLIPETANRG